MLGELRPLLLFIYLLIITPIWNVQLLMLCASCVKAACCSHLTWALVLQIIGHYAMVALGELGYSQGLMKLGGNHQDYWRSVSSSWRSSCFWRLFMHCLKLHDVHHSIHSFTTLIWRPFIHGHLIPKSTLQSTPSHPCTFWTLLGCKSCLVLFALLVQCWVHCLSSTECTCYLFRCMSCIKEGWLPSVLLG